jgi:hypothetical protein
MLDCSIKKTTLWIKRCTQHQTSNLFCKTRLHSSDYAEFTYIYIHTHTRFVQHGAGFRLSMRSMRRSVETENTPYVAAVRTYASVNVTRPSQSWKNVPLLCPDVIIGFFNWPNPSSRTMALGSAKTLTENIPGDKARPARKADNLTAICEPTA